MVRDFNDTFLQLKKKKVSKDIRNLNIIQEVDSIDAYGIYHTRTAVYTLVLNV